MKVVTTPKEIMDAPLVGSWDIVCDELGLNPWCVNEGQMESKERIELPVALAQRIGLLDAEED
jgi:hypothetical protein